MEEYIYPPIILIVSFLYFVSYSRRIWDVVDTPTVTPSGAIIGLCEISGKAAPPFAPDGKPVPLHTSPVSKSSCVWYSLHVEKYVKQGDDSKWITFRTDVSAGGFRIADKYGSVSVSPKYDQEYLPRTLEDSQSTEHIERAYHHLIHDESENVSSASTQWTLSPDNYYMWHPKINKWIPATYVSPDHLQYFDLEKNEWVLIEERKIYDKSLLEMGENKTSIWGNKNYRVTEIAVIPDSDIFSHGYVNVSADGVDLVIGRKDKSDDSFIVSATGEQNVLKSLRWKKWISFTVWLITTFVCAVYGYHLLEKYDVVPADSGDVTWLTIVIPCGIVIVLTTFGSAIIKVLRTYNRFIRLREQVRLSRSAIDITLKRRSTLIPQLCEVILGIMQHEKTVLDSVTRLRSEDPERASKDILALAESYPAIASSENFLHLQNELGRTEEKIAMARSFLNDSILAMDNLRATFVGMIFSPLFAKEKRLNE